MLAAVGRLAEGLRCSLIILKAVFGYYDVGAVRATGYLAAVGTVTQSLSSCAVSAYILIEGNDRKKKAVYLDGGLSCIAVSHSTAEAAPLRHDGLDMEI